MHICDGCGRKSDFVSLFGNVVLCDECTEPYGEALMKCRSRKEYDVLARRVHSEVVRRGRK